MPKVGEPTVADNSSVEFTKCLVVSMGKDIAFLEEELERSNNQSRLLIREVTELEIREDELRRYIATLENQNADLRLENEHLASENEHWKNSMDSLSEEDLDLVLVNKHLSQEVKDLKEELEELEKHTERCECVDCKLEFIEGLDDVRDNGADAGGELQRD